ncbi:11418_t:CDS:1, partial [Racocetra fulgida]
MPSFGSFPHSFPSNKLGGASKNAPQLSTPGGENQMKAPPNPAEAMLPHNKATNQQATNTNTTSEPTQPTTASPQKTSVSTTSNAPKPS